MTKNKTGFGNQFSASSTFTPPQVSDDGSLVPEDDDDNPNNTNHSTPTNNTNNHASPPRTKVDLKMAARQRRALQIREQNHEIEEVAILASDPAKEAKKHSFTRIEEKLEQKRDRHDKAAKKYKQQLRDVSDDVEIYYVKEADRIKEALNSIDGQIKDVFVELDKDEILEMKDYTYVTDMWDKINELLSSRTDEVLHFGDQLESFERTRSSTMARNLRAMVDSQVQIGLKLPQEIERAAEQESFELNSVIIGNRRAHAELTSRMEKEDIIEKVEARKKWEIRCSDWRTLRHNRGIREFHQDITADNFTNPPNRVALFEEFKASQDVRHEMRIKLLRSLGCLDNHTLSSSGVDNTRSNFKDINDKELKAIKALYDDAMALKFKKHDEAEQRREDLRAELHIYGALHNEPDLESGARTIDEQVSQTALEEFFRKSGGLKHALVAIAKQLRDPSLIYQKYLHEVSRGIGVLLCSKDLEVVLEKQGKDSMRKNMQDTLERLRKATKSEVVPVLPLLKQQCVDLAVVNKIDPMLKRELSTASDQLQDLISSVANSLNSAASRVSKTDSRANSTRRESRAGNLGGLNDTGLGMTGASNAGGPSAPPSESIRSRRSSTRRNSTSAGASKGWDDGPEIDMLQVRNIQKHLGMLMAVCELSPEFLECLGNITTGLVEKGKCNEFIDAVVKGETSKPIKDRDLEQDSLIDWVEQSLSVQAVTLNSGAERMCSFYHAIAKILEKHREKEMDIDETAADLMFELKEDFRMADEDREADVDHALDRLRHAADEKELEFSFDHALKMLNVIENEYRVYHKKGVLTAAKHPVAVDGEHRRFCFLVCDRFGLVPPKEMALPEKEEEEEEEVKKTVVVADEEVIADKVGEGSDGADNGGADNSDDNGAGEGEAKDETQNEGQEEEAQQEAHFHDDGTPFTEEEEAAHKAEVLLEEQQRKAEEEARLLAEEEAKSKIVITAGDELWNDEIADIFQTGVSRYLYGIKLAADDMVAELLAPPADGEDEEDDLPKAFPVYERKVEKVSNEDEEEDGTANNKADKTEKADGESDAESDANDVVFFDNFELLSDDAVAEMNESERDAYIEEHDKRFIPLTQEEVNALPDDESFATYSKCLTEINARREEKATIMLGAKAKRDNTPVDKDGRDCIRITKLPINESTSFVGSLRESVLSCMEEDSLARQRKMDALNEERAEDLTEELEERLRLHWPRKGRTEVKFRQPREGELVAHRQKSARFLRQFYQRLNEQDGQFSAIREKVIHHSDEFKQAVQLLKCTLANQGSLAALQGQEMRCKKLLANFGPECEELREEMDTFITTKPKKLVNTIHTLIKTTLTFQQGGDYDKKEVDDLKLLLVEPDKKVKTAVANRESVIKETEEYQVEATMTTKDFKVEYERCLLELSLRLGLGKKFGAPRRNAQERLRTEVTRDEYSAENVDKLLNNLEKLCDIAKKNAKKVSFEDGKSNNNNGSDKNGENGDKSIAVLITHCLLSIRSALYRRAMYLDFLHKPELIDAERVIPPSLEEEGQDGHVAEDAMIVGTFASAIDTLQKQCREETRNLYEQEGKSDLLGDEGVPDSLREWLNQSWIKVLGSKDEEEILNEAVVIAMDGKDTYTVQYTDGLEEKNVPAVLIRTFGSKPVRAPEPPIHSPRTRVQVHFQCHREKSRRRLRAQVERLERLIAKTPVPPNPTVLGAPSAAVVDVMGRCKQESKDTVKKSEAGFQKLLAIWDAARTKHKSSLRPQLGSPDAAALLEKLKDKEIKRSAEVKNAVDKFKTNLLSSQTTSSTQTIQRLVSILKTQAAIVDTLVLREDFFALPGDELILPKRKSLKRLRKASTSGKDGKVGDDEDGGGDGGGGGGGDEAPKTVESGGRQFVKRKWAPLPLGVFADQMRQQQPVQEEPEKVEEEVVIKGGKKKAVAAEEEGEEKLSEVDLWAKKQSEDSIFESCLTTSHRCLVKMSLSCLDDYTTFYRDQMEGIRAKYENLYAEEEIWEKKWLGLCADLKGMN